MERKINVEFLLHYHISNNGDGSASINLHPTAEAAEKADGEDEQGWGEPCMSHKRIRLENNQLFYQDYQENADGKYAWVWVPLEKVK